MHNHRYHQCIDLLRVGAGRSHHTQEPVTRQTALNMPVKKQKMINLVCDQSRGNNKIILLRYKNIA